MIYSKALASCSFVFHLIVLPGEGDGCAPRRMTKVAPTTTPDLSQDVLRKKKNEKCFPTIHYLLYFDVICPYRASSSWLFIFYCNSESPFPL